MIDLSVVITQSQFGELVGISQPAVSGLLSKGVLTDGSAAGVWLLEYCANLREQASGRLGVDVGGLDLVQERAALAREQRRGIEIKNAVLRGQYADVALLSEVLAIASQSVSQRFDHLPGQVRKACPDVPADVMALVMTAIAAARNEWVKQTAALVAEEVVSIDDDLPEFEFCDDQGTD